VWLFSSIYSIHGIAAFGNALCCFRPKYAVFVEHTKCTSQKQLDEKLKYVLDRGGEGLMIRKPGSKYERCRSHTLLKIKKFYDAEVLLLLRILV
jgi:DNA ligase-1